MLSIFGSLIVATILQLIIYPFLAKNLTSSDFGSFLTIIGISNALGVIFGSSITNLKLITQNTYIEDLKNKDFKKLLFNSSLVITAIMIVVLLLYSNKTAIIESILIIILTILTMFRAYMVAYYRIELNYKLILYHLIITGIGYIIGIIIYKAISYWPIIFLTGEIFAYVFAFRTTVYKYEEYNTSKLFKKTEKEYLQLLSSSSVTNILVYLDRIIINPILGASNVTVYYIASFMGKTLGIVLQPLSAIILTYLSKGITVDKKILFKYYVSLTLLLGFLMFIISIPLTPVLIRILYPQNFNSAKEYLNIGNLGVILTIMGTLIQPFLLKYCPLWWQPIIEIIYGLISIIGGIVFMLNMGIYGFCIVVVIANLIRLVMLLTIGYYYIYKL